MQNTTPKIIRCTVAIAALCTLLSLVPASAQEWQPVPFVSPQMKAQGLIGGEGCQWPQAIAISTSDPNFLLFGTDVGGIYRSLNGGRLWEPCNVGYVAHGNTGLAIDPHNARRALAVGANSSASKNHGLFLTTDQAASWKAVLESDTVGYRDFRDQIAYDANTFDAKLGYTKTVYWSRRGHEENNWGVGQIHPALYKSEDGGATWKEMPNSSAYGDSFLKIHPRKAGVLYAGNRSGFFRSDDGGAHWKRTDEAMVYGVSVSPARPQSVWISTAFGVFRSDDDGQNWTKLGAASLLKGREQDQLRSISINPVDANTMTVWRMPVPFAWEFTRFVSQDGGATWREVRFDNTNAFMPNNTREGIWAWHPTNARIGYSSGGDWPTKTQDGGQSWEWWGNGYNAVVLGGKWNFNVFNPDLLFAGAGDYAGAVTRDGGKTWQYTPVSGQSWGGASSGAYAATSTFLYAADGAPNGDLPRNVMKVSRDGGKTWAPQRDVDGKLVVLSGPHSSLGDPTTRDVLFASNYRSVDGGKSWRAMSTCDAAYVASAGRDHALFGVKIISADDPKRTDIVRSTDKGASWQVVATLDDRVKDLAFDHVRNRIYVAGSWNLSFFENGRRTVVSTPKDQTGGDDVETVAIDPTDPSIVYVGSEKGWQVSNVSLVRSIDAGRTWTNLTRNVPLDGVHRDGGREVYTVRVNPKTREAWVSTNCYGVWKIGPPQKSLRIR